MYLSEVEINPYRRESSKALSSPEIMHAAVERSFPSFDRPADYRNLWRVDRVGEATMLLVQSTMKPDLTHIVERFGRPACEPGWHTLDYEDFLMDIHTGDVRKFRLRANPIRNVSSGIHGERGKVCHHITREQQLKWLVDKSVKHGFTVGDELCQYHISSAEVLRFQHNGGRVSFSAVLYEGVLKVTDRDLFVASIRNGIGREKAYGCGMMSVSRRIGE